jgi:hypothetical protein
LFEASDDHKARRRKDLHKATYVIVIDDVIEKVNPEKLKNLPPPSYILETSPGNEQWGYILEVPEVNQARVDKLLDGLVASGIADDGRDPGMKGVTRYVRLPVGSNTKAKYKEVFLCKLTLWEPSRVHRLEDLARPFSIDVANIQPKSQKYGAGIPETLDPVVPLLSQIGIFKGKVKPDTYDVECPWMHEHSGAADTGSAYLSPFGFKCHHGSHADKHFEDLLNYIDDQLPGAIAAIRWARCVRDFDDDNRWPFQVAATRKTKKEISDHAGWLHHLRVLDPLKYDQLKEGWVMFGSVTSEEISALETHAQQNLESAGGKAEAEDAAHSEAAAAILLSFGNLTGQEQAVLLTACRAAVLEYEKNREGWANALSVRRSVLDEQRALYQKALDTALVDAGIVEEDDGKQGRPLSVSIPKPALTTQNGPAVFQDSFDHLKGNVVAEPEQHTAMALYALFTHAHQQGLHGLAPKLGLLSPTKEAGKSTAAKTIAALGGAGITYIDVSGPILFRSYEQIDTPFTMYLDEFDAKANDMPEPLRAILNAGYDIETARVPRCVGDDHEVREFHCYGPQVFCCIDKMPDTITSRSIIINMRRAGRGDTWQRRYSLDDARKQTEAALAGRAARLIEDNIEAMKDRLKTVKMPDLGSPRREDNWRPLFAIADVMFGGVPDMIREAAFKLSSENADRGDRVSMLLDDLALLVVGIFGADWRAVLKVSPRPGLPTSLILDYLLCLDTRPWIGWAGGNPITTRHLSKILSPIRVNSTEIGEKSARRKGYPLDALARVFDSYGAVMPTTLDDDQKLDVKAALNAQKNSLTPAMNWPDSWAVTSEARS